MSALAAVATELEPFLQQLSSAISGRQLHKLVLSKYHGSEPLKQLQVRPVMLKQQWQLSFTYKYQTNDVTRNFSAGAALGEIVGLVDGLKDGDALGELVGIAGEKVGPVDGD